MGTVTVGKCKCECYINYVSCDYSIEQQSEIRSHRPERKNRFMDQPQRTNSKRSPGDSQEKQSKFSSTRNQSRSEEKYLHSDYCDIVPTEESQIQTFVNRKQDIRLQTPPKHTQYTFHQTLMEETVEGDKEREHFTQKNSRESYRSSLNPSENQTFNQQFLGVGSLSYLRQSIKKDGTSKESSNEKTLISQDVNTSVIPIMPDSLASQSIVRNSTDQKSSKTLQILPPHMRQSQTQEKVGVLKRPSDEQGRQNSKSQQTRVRWNLPQSYYVRERAQQQQQFFA